MVRWLRPVAFLLLAVLIAVGWVRTRPQPLAPDGPRGGDFVLQGVDGPVSLSDLRGQVVALYFGYTSCPDVCPTSLSLLGAGIAQLDAAEQRRVTGLFVSVDPERDTFPRIETYAGYFHPRIHALTGSHEVLDELGPRYGAAWRRVDLDGSAMGYAVDHSSATTLIGPDGEIREVLPHGTAAEQVAAALRRALDHGTPEG